MIVNELQEKICCFTGHRVIPPEKGNQIEQRAETLILDLYNRGIHLFRVGGAVGFDTMMAQLLFRLRVSGKSEIRVALFYPFYGFTEGWTESQKKRYEELLPQYDDVVRVSEKPDRVAYLARNRALVDGASFCITYCTRTTGGTAYTVRYAEKRGVKVYNIRFSADCSG